MDRADSDASRFWNCRFGRDGLVWLRMVSSAEVRFRKFRSLAASKFDGEGQGILSSPRTVPDCSGFRSLGNESRAVAASADWHGHVTALFLWSTTFSTVKIVFNKTCIRGTLDLRQTSEAGQCRRHSAGSDGLLKMSSRAIRNAARRAQHGHL